MILRVGTRPSRLAIRQVEEIAGIIPLVRFEVVSILTKGDADKATPLSYFEGSDFFTGEIEAALLKGEIDVAIHSAKDLEEKIPSQLMIAALTGSVSPYECLVSRSGKTLDGLPLRAVIGTSSKKRQEAVLRYRKDLIVKDIRGDIEERLHKLDRGEFDAIIVAHVALIRLGLENRIAEIILPAIIKPYPLQGRLAVQIRKERKDLIGIFRGIHAG